MPPGPDREEVERWIRLTQEFQRSAAPNAFKWIGWCLILSAIRFAGEATGEWALDAIWGLLIFLLWGYFAYFFFEKEIKWRTRVEMRAWSNIASWILGFVCTALMVVASVWLSNVLREHAL